MAVITSVFSYKLLISLTIIIGFKLIMQKFSNLILPILILSYLVVTSDYFKDYRMLVNLFSTFTLVFIFLKKFGFNINNYPKIPIGLIAFCLLLLFTLITSSIFSSYFLISITATIRMILFLFISYMFYALINDDRDISKYIYAIIIAMLIIGFPMIVDAYNLGLQKYFIRILLSEKLDLLATTRFSSFTIFFIAITLSVSMLLIKKNQFGLLNIIFSVVLVLNVIILILANSRGGILAAIVSIAFIGLILKRRLFFKTIIIVSLILLIFMFTNTEVNNAMATYLRLETVSDREVYWQMGLDVISDYPLAGVGVDVFDKHFYNYASSRTLTYFKSDIINIGKPHPHNFFIFFTAENGILGLITSIIFFIVFFYYAVKAIFLSKNDYYDYYVIMVAITGIGIGIFVRSFLEITGYLVYGYITRDLPFWLLFGIVIFIYRRLSNEKMIDKQKTH